MVVTPELRAQILRLYLADQWRVGTIARQLQLHRDTVRRVLAVTNVLRAPSAVAPRLIDPFMPFIQETLAKFPTLAASRLYAMVQERGYARKIQQAARRDRTVTTSTPPANIDDGDVPF